MIDTVFYDCWVEKEIFLKGEKIHFILAVILNLGLYHLIFDIFNATEKFLWRDLIL